MGSFVRPLQSSVHDVGPPLFVWISLCATGDEYVVVVQNCHAVAGRVVGQVGQLVHAGVPLVGLAGSEADVPNACVVFKTMFYGRNVYVRILDGFSDCQLLLPALHSFSRKSYYWQPERLLSQC